MLCRIQNSDLRITSKLAGRAFRISTGRRTSLLPVCLSHFCSYQGRRVRTFNSILSPLDCGTSHVIFGPNPNIIRKPALRPQRRRIALPSVTTDHRATNPSGGPDEQRPSTTRDQHDKRHKSVSFSPTNPRD
jgi:hypothetical protein